MTVERKRVLGRVVTVLGWAAVLLIPLAIVDMVETLPLMPEAWWRPSGEVPLPPGQFDLRMMIICPGFMGWFGGWGYLIALGWLPVAAYQAWRGFRAGVAFKSHERILLMLVPTLVILVQLLLRLTPLRYAYPLV